MWGLATNSIIQIFLSLSSVFLRNQTEFEKQIEREILLTVTARGERRGEHESRSVPELAWGVAKRPYYQGRLGRRTLRSKWHPSRLGVFRTRTHQVLMVARIGRIHCKQRWTTKLTVKPESPSLPAFWVSAFGQEATMKLPLLKKYGKEARWISSTKFLSISNK